MSLERSEMPYYFLQEEAGKVKAPHIEPDSETQPW